MKHLSSLPREAPRNPFLFSLSFPLCSSASSMKAEMPSFSERSGAGGEESVAVPQIQEVKAAEPKKRNPCPGVRVIGGRIYDPENGKTCHQCRQKTRDFAAACKQPKKKGLCPINYCHKCLLNRYGENAEEVAQQEAWICPKCRGICNCSFCRKKKGETPTGILAHAAKASGCSSVHDLLIKGSDMVAAAQTLISIPLKVNVTEKGNRKRALGTDDATNGLSGETDENTVIDLNTVSSVPIKKRRAERDENTVIDLNAVPSVPIKKRRKSRVNNGPDDGKFLGENNCEPLLRDERPDALQNKVVLPRGTAITNIAGAEMKAEDVGPAIQFYEFLRSFAEIFQIRKGQPEKILQGITGGRELREVPSLIAEFHINLLSVIQEDREEKPLNYSRDRDAWIIDVGKYINESTFISKELPLGCLNQGVAGYKKLSPSCKLHVLNFLCDETLSTAKLRNWIDKQNERAAERKSAATEKIRSAKEKEKELKERLKNDMVKAMLLRGGKTPSIEGNNNLVSQIKEAKEVKQAAINEKKLGDALRTKPVMVDKGVAYWKLDGYCNNTTIMRQDFDTLGNKDKWFMFTEDEAKVIEDNVATSNGEAYGRSRSAWR